jgi:hypothetical protein
MARILSLLVVLCNLIRRLGLASKPFVLRGDVFRKISAKLKILGTPQAMTKTSTYSDGI